MTDQSVSEGTWAEVLTVLAVWSDSLNESCAALYAQLARDLLGVEIELEDERRPRESSPGASTQRLASFERICSCRITTFRSKKSEQDLLARLEDVRDTLHRC